jgi:hypothetical protein
MKEIKITVKNPILPNKYKVLFKPQKFSNEVVVMYIGVEKSILTEDYKKDSSKIVMQPICRFNRKSPTAKTMEHLYSVCFDEMFIN